MKKGKDYIGVGCGAVIINEKEEVLLMKRTEKCRNQAGYWIRPGGAVDFGETLEEAVIREVEEEIGVKVEVIGLLEINNDIMPKEKQHWIAVSYLCKIKSGEIKNIEPHKCDEIKWFSIYNLPKKMTLPTKVGIKKYIEKYKTL